MVTCLTIQDAASFLGVSKRTIYREIERGHLEAVKVGTALRIPPESIENYLKERSCKV